MRSLDETLDGRNVGPQSPLIVSALVLLKSALSLHLALVRMLANDDGYEARPTACDKGSR